MNINLNLPVSESPPPPPPGYWWEIKWSFLLLARELRVFRVGYRCQIALFGDHSPWVITHVLWSPGAPAVISSLCIAYKSAILPLCMVIHISEGWVCVFVHKSAWVESLMWRHWSRSVLNCCPRQSDLCNPHSLNIEWIICKLQHLFCETGNNFLDLIIFWVGGGGARGVVLMLTQLLWCPSLLHYKAI